MLRALSRRFVDMSRYDQKQAATFTDKLFLVDYSDTVKRQISKKEAHLNSYNYSPAALPHRAFSLFVFNSKNELLLQQRAHKKITYALYWTNTCCSHQTTADDPISSKKDVITRLKGEVGIDLYTLKTVKKPLDDLKFLSRVIYKDRSDETWGEYELDYIYFLKQGDYMDTKTVPTNPDEVEALQWLKREDARDFVARQDIKVTPWFRRIVKQANFISWWEALEQGRIDAFAEQAEIQHLQDD